MSLKSTINKATNAAKKTINNVKKDPIGAAATAAKAAVGGVQGAVQAGISALANCKMLKGTKTGTTLDIANTLVAVPGAWQDIGIDAIAGLASGIYQGKPISQLDDIAFAAATKSAKGNVDDIVDKSLAALKAYDVNFTKQDLNKFGKDLKQYIKGTRYR